MIEIPLHHLRTSENDRPNAYLKNQRRWFTHRLAAASSGIAVYKLGEYRYGAGTPEQ
jgi:hypothetical protein